jgi:hypothetical protein
MQPWIDEELRTADLNHQRREKRFALVLDRLSRKPSLKFNAACRGKAEVKAAYTFVNNPAVTPQAVLAPHHDATTKRIGQHRVVLVAQDTTEIDVTRKRERMKGAGPLNEPNRLGFHLHNLLAMTPAKIPLGVVWAHTWARDPQQFGQPSQRKHKPIEQKETFRWLEGYRQACSVATACPDTQVVCLGDSENDIYECLFEGRRPVAAGQRKADWIIRACHERALVSARPDARPTPPAQAEQGADAQTAYLFAEVARRPVLKRLTLEVSQREPKSEGQRQRKRRQPRAARRAVVTVQAAKVTLRGVYRPGGQQPDVTVNAVLLREENPPEGEPAIEWLLLTNLPIRTVKQVLRVVEYYCCRWQIEIYYRVVKSGCKVEKAQFETAEAFLPYLALCLIVAWRVMYVMMLGRNCPEVPADRVLEEEEWQAVYAVVKGETPPKEAPPLAEVVKQIAALGGWQGRPSDGPPGPKALWVGMQRMTDLALGWQAREREGSQVSKGQGEEEAASARTTDARAPPHSPKPPSSNSTTVQSSGIR